MPAAIPGIISGVGAVGSWLGGRNQQQQQNQYNQQAVGKYNDLNTGFGNKMSGLGDQAQAQNQGLFNNITGGIGQLWNNAQNGPQPSFDAQMSSSQPFYTKAMNTGLFDQGQMNDFRARGALQNDQIFQGLARQLSQAANVRGGGYAGYSGQNAQMQRDAARQGEANRLNTEGDLQSQIRQNMFGGASGVAGNDQNFANQRLASANLQGENLNRQFGESSSLLNALQGLRTQGTNDQGYYNQAGGSYRNYMVNPQQAQTPWYGGVGGGLQGIGAGLMGSNFGQRKPTGINSGLNTNSSGQLTSGLL